MFRSAKKADLCTPNCFSAAQICCFGSFGSLAGASSCERGFSETIWMTVVTAELNLPHC